MQRNMLPIAAYRDTIIEMLEMSQVIVLSGETGWCVIRYFSSRLILISRVVESPLSCPVSYWKINCQEGSTVK